MLGTLFYFLVTLAILVAVHEFGHFWVARKLGVKVLTFSIGFGQPLLQRTDSQGTRYVLAAIPLGGYVRMLDEREASVAPDQLHKAFNRQPLWSRAAIILAGPVANFLLAVLVYWLVFVVGIEGIKPVIGEVQGNSVAERAGLHNEQRIVAVDGKPVHSQAQVNMALIKRIGDSGQITLETVYRGSNVTNAHQLPIERWLVGSETRSPYSALGFSYWQPAWPALLDSVAPGQPAAAAGIRAGDQIVSIDGVAIEVWQDAVAQIKVAAGRNLAIEVERGGQRITMNVRAQPHQLASGETIGRIGVSVARPQWPEDMRVLVRAGVLSGLVQASAETWGMLVFTLESIKKMLYGLISTENLSGPVTIAKIASASADSGAVAYLQFLALISISLGVINLLPIPVLDGGQLLFLGVEAITGKALSEKVMLVAQQAGLMLILAIMALALYNDFTRL